MNAQKLFNHKKASRVRRTRAKIAGTAVRPRLAVFRSNVGIYAQLIDDAGRKTIAAASSREVAKKGMTKTEAARLVGESIAKKAVAAKVSAAVFDRRSYAYHGRVKAVADGARSGGLKF